MRQQQVGDRRRRLSFQFPHWLLAVLGVVAIPVVGVKMGALITNRVLGVKAAPGARPTDFKAQLRHMMRTDPKVGCKIVLAPIEDLHGNLVQLPLQGSVTALLYVQHVEGEDEDIALLEGQIARDPRVKGCVAFALSDPRKVTEAQWQKGYRSVFLYDRGGELWKTLNAFDNARFYLIGGDGTLLWLENPADSDEQILAKAKEAIKRALGGT